MEPPLTSRARGSPRRRAGQMKLIHIWIIAVILAVLCTLGLMVFQKTLPGAGFKKECAREGMADYEREACESFK
jgi:hypothetical protein